MTAKRKNEAFTAGYHVCDAAIELVNRVACSSCEVEILDIHQQNAASQAKQYDVSRVPSVVIDGNLADCCSLGGPDEQTLRAIGLGQPLA